MDEDMWLHPATQRNLGVLRGFGNLILEVAMGELASGLFGPGRMLEPEQILAAIEAKLLGKQLLAGKKVLVTAGPTYESIDPVRFIGNHSSGKMGIAIAKACSDAGADVTLVLGPTAVQVPPSVMVVRVQSAQEMYDAAISAFATCHLAVMAAAVADYRPASVAQEKIKKAGETLTLHLVKTPDILKACGVFKKADQILMGFALETNNEAENALKKLHEKNADFIVLNSLANADAGFGTDTNKVTIFGKSEPPTDLPLMQKAAVAEHLVQMVARRFIDLKNVQF